jgi:acyl-[acyl-carrier-protein] desaturase
VVIQGEEGTIEQQVGVPVTSKRFEVIKSMESFVANRLGALLKPVRESWQPSDFLPDMAKSDWTEQLRSFRERAKSLSDELLVVLVGDMITEEALPTYQTWLNRLQGVADRTGADGTPWAQWSRGWTAEENRHGDLLNRYLYLTGRVDMRAIETTVQNLISNGFDPLTDDDPYLGFVYTSFQERATKISHRNVGTLAAKAGEEKLQQICGYIAGDEARHEKAYTLFMTKIFELDPAEAVRSFAAMMKRKIVMPAVLMRDNSDEDLYAKFSRVAQQIGVYTARDYADIVEHLVQHWAIARLRGLSDQAAKAQDYLCTLAARYRALAERISFGREMKFSWIFDRQVV